MRLFFAAMGRFGNVKNWNCVRIFLVVCIYRYRDKSENVSFAQDMCVVLMGWRYEVLINRGRTGIRSQTSRIRVFFEDLEWTMVCWYMLAYPL